MSTTITTTPWPKMTFHCPRCGGECFGTGREGRGRLVGNCQENAPGCLFRWDRKDDWKYFDIAGKKYSSRAGYEAALPKPVTLVGRRA